MGRCSAWQVLFSRQMLGGAEACRPGGNTPGGERNSIDRSVSLSGQHACADMMIEIDATERR